LLARAYIISCQRHSGRCYLIFREPKKCVTTPAITKVVIWGY
jgi:hypothetical protein